MARHAQPPARGPSSHRICSSTSPDACTMSVTSSAFHAVCKSRRDDTAGATRPVFLPWVIGLSRQEMTWAASSGNPPSTFEVSTPRPRATMAMLPSRSRRVHHLTPPGGT
ncbi:hypothetical protein CFC21_005055, partial [Triticum aestivum]